MLHQMQLHLGLQTTKDKELEEMKAPTDLNQIHQTLDKQDGKTEPPEE
jgi:hypothetical protein